MKEHVDACWNGSNGQRFTEERDDNQVAWREQETGSSKDEALAKGAKHQGVTAALGRLPWSGKISEGSTAAVGGPSNSGTQSIVSRGARSTLGRPLYSAETPSRGSAVKGSDIEGSTVCPVANGHLIDHDMLKVCPSDH